MLLRATSKTIFGKYHAKINLVVSNLCFSYKSIGQVARTLYKTSGFKAFINGLGPTLVRAFPANAATFFAYEMAMDFMNRQ